MALALNSNKTNGAKKQKYQNLSKCYFQGIEAQLITNVHFVFCVMAINCGISMALNYIYIFKS